MSATLPNLLGIIDPDRMYSLQRFQEVSGIGKAGLRSARKQGLEVRYLGNMGFILGADFIRFIKENGKRERS